MQVKLHLSYSIVIVTRTRTRNKNSPRHLCPSSMSLFLETSSDLSHLFNIHNKLLVLNIKMFFWMNMFPTCLWAPPQGVPYVAKLEAMAGSRPVFDSSWFIVYFWDLLFQKLPPVKLTSTRLKSPLNCQIVVRKCFNFVLTSCPVDCVVGGWHR